MEPLLIALTSGGFALGGVGLGAWLQHRAETAREDRRIKLEWLSRVSQAATLGREWLFSLELNGHPPSEPETLDALHHVAIAHPDPDVSREAFRAHSAMGTLRAWAEHGGPEDDVERLTQEVTEALGHLATLARTDAYGNE